MVVQTASCHLAQAAECHLQAAVCRCSKETFKQFENFKVPTHQLPMMICSSKATQDSHHMPKRTLPCTWGSIRGAQVVVQQRIDLRGPRELGGVAEAALLGVEASPKHVGAAVQRSGSCVIRDLALGCCRTQ